MTTTTATELLNRRVVTTTDATDAGEVKGFVADRDMGRIRRVHVAGSTRLPKLVDWSRITDIGPDAVMVQSREDIHESVNDADDLFINGDIALIGAKVLDTGGRFRGEVRDLHIDVESGAITAVMTTDGRIEAADIKSIGTFALVIAE